MSDYPNRLAGSERSMLMRAIYAWRAILRPPINDVGILVIHDSSLWSGFNGTALR
jgi:hypothetical protein